MKTQAFIILLIFFVASSCQKDKKDMFFYHAYNKGKKLIPNKGFIIEQTNDQFILKSLSDSIVYKTKQIETDSGVFRNCNESLRLIYSFTNLNGSFCKSIPQVINFEIIPVNQNSIIIKEQEYKIFKYREKSFLDESYNSYYVQNKGLLGIYCYDGESEYFFICDSTNHNSVMPLISKAIIKDTLFFEKSTDKVFKKNIFKLPNKL